jgi:hypothetical protein
MSVKAGTGSGGAEGAPMNVSDMTRQWDKGSKTQRVAILTNFLRRHRHSTAAEIERDLGHGALLFFTRITAWLRLTYRLGTAVSLQLSALSVFLQGQKYLTQFMEVGGIQALTDLVAICTEKRRDDKNNALLLLLHIANSGRVYREMVCDGEGIEMLVTATATEHDDRTLDLLASLFLGLGQGNPRKAASVHAGLLEIMKSGEDDGALCAATTLRSLQLAKQSFVGDTGGAGMVGVEPSGTSASGSGHAVVLDAFFHLLRSPNVKLRFEGMELLSIAAQNHQLLAPVIRQCLETLEASELTFDDDPGALQPERRLKSSCGRILCNIVLSPLPAEQAEQVLLLLERFSAHLTLAKHLRLCDGRDVPGSIEAVKTLRRMALGPYVSIAGTGISRAVSQTVSQWLRRRVGDDMYEALVDSDPLVDELALNVATRLLDTEREKEQAQAKADDAAEANAAAQAAVAAAMKVETPQPAPAASATPTRSEVFGDDDTVR